MLELTKECDKPAGASEDLIKRLQDELGFALPSDYIDFVRFSDGAEGFIEDGGYVMFWPVREIIDRKEIHIEVVAPPVAPRPVQHPVKVAPAPAPAYVPPPAPQAAPAPEAAPLPKTGTADPLLAVAGVALVLGGLALRRLV